MKNVGEMNIVQRVLRLVGPLLAFRYCRAAKQDEDNGLPFTAAMEWRQAAELSSWVTSLANSYWREWERIMQMSRSLAEPIGVNRGCNEPIVYFVSHPIGHWNRSDVASLFDKINDRPVLFALLKVIQSQLYGFVPPQPAGEQQCQQCAVAFSFHR